MSVIEAVCDLAASIADFFAWRADWHRTWSPVSYWIALLTGIGIVALALLYGHAVWNYLFGR